MTNKQILREELHKIKLESKYDSLNQELNKIISILSEDSAPTYTWDMNNGPVKDRVSPTINLNVDKKENSPTFEWNNIKNNIDGAIQDIDRNYIEEFLDYLYNKVKILPRNIKIKIMKYALGTLITVFGISTVSGEAESVSPEVLSYIDNSMISNTEASTKTIDDFSRFEAPNDVTNSFSDWIKYHEGSARYKGEPKLKVYDINDSMYTVGWGHAERKGKTKLKPGQKITRAQAEKYLAQDIATAKDAVDDILDEWKQQGIKYQVTPGMYDAMVSAAFNMGRSGFRKTQFIQLVKQGKYEEAAKRLLNTRIKPGTEHEQGLRNRRKSEVEKFMSDGLPEF